MTRTAGAPIGCQRPSRFWGLGCPKIYHEAEDTLVVQRRLTAGEAHGRHLAFMPELVQHGTDLCHAHNFFIIHRL
ncbi:hypothetical protein, partial [Thiolapillus sp.]|uniref:hypothetical protein n=1 Tax=Thiolapillus sp. TaxID=2017437 RepID=UPI003AF6842C